MEAKVCKTCKKIKDLSFFPRTKMKVSYYYYPNCKECSRSSRRKILEKYYQNNREDILSEGRERYHNTKHYQIIRAARYRQENKEQIRLKRNARVRRKRAESPVFRIKSNISRTIRGVLKSNGSSKNGISFLKYVGYTMQELKAHIEKQFEPWMNWNNWGVYYPKNWDDNDSSTFVWQLDHIIPQSKLPYQSMDEGNFKKCWALENLRPLSAKQNFLNGIELLKVSK